MGFSNPEDQKRYAREWYIKNRDRVLTRSQRQRLEDPVGTSEYNARYRAEHREEIRVKSRVAQRVRKYGDAYDRLIVEQDGLCAICGEPPWPGRTLQVDHDHNCCSTDVTCFKCVRALLCEHCNKGLGHFRDNPALLRQAADYLERTTKEVYA